MARGAMLVHDARIFDGVEVIPHGSVLVEDGLVTAVGDDPPFPTLSRPEEATGFVRGRIAERSDYLKVIVEDGSALRHRLGRRHHGARRRRAMGSAVAPGVAGTADLGGGDARRA